jgi:YjgF/chorismate_mutase-like, putative endoribonuclease
MSASAPVSPEERVRELGLEIPDYNDPPYGGRYGRLKAFHRIGKLVMLGGITPEERDGTLINPGRLGEDLTIEQGYEAARKAALNCLGMTRLALGSLDEVASLARVQCFIVATPDFDQHHLVGKGMTDLWLEVFGDEMGMTGRADMGVVSLSNKNCLELWLTLESKSEPDTE